MKNRTNLIVWGLTFILYPFIIYAYYQLDSNQVILHWGMHGVADGYGPKWLLFCFPLVIIIMDSIFVVSRKYDSFKKQKKKNDSAFASVRIMIASFLALFNLVCIALQFPIDYLQINVIMIILVAFLFLLLGNILPRVRPNWIIGIRLPWTLSNDLVWQKTHRIAGRMWFFGSFFMLISIFLPEVQRITYFLCITILITVLPCIYSYILYKKLK